MTLSIAIIAHIKYPIIEPFAGGLEMHTHLLARKLLAKGHKVTVFAKANSDKKIGSHDICCPRELQEIGTSEAPDIIFFKEHHAYLSLMMRLRRAKFDIIHNNSLHYLPISLADSLDIPIITTLHTPPFCWLESAIRASQRQANYFVAVSRSLEKLWQHVIKVDKIIANGIDLRHFPFQARAAQPPYAIWYGRIVPEKGLAYAIKASKKAGLKLKFAGPIADQNYFAQEIKPLLQGANGQIEYLGHHGHKQLAQYIAQASVTLCTPCWEEPFGLVIVESLACGVPVAAFNRGAVSEILTAKSGALARPNDSDSLALAIEQARHCRRQDCYERALAIADSQKMVDQYEKLYYQIIASKEKLKYK